MIRTEFTWIAAGAALIYLYVTRRKTRREWVIKARVAASPDRVFQLHLDPVWFYRVLTFMPKGPIYRVLRVDKDPGGASLAYDLEHKTLLKVIKSRPQRLNIDEKARRFDETFTALGTTFYFQWKFDEASESDAETNICLTVTLTGPLLGVWFFSVAGGGPEKIWNRRFETTNQYLKELLEN